MYNQRQLTLKTPNKLSNRLDWDYSSYEKKNKNGGTSGLAEGNSFSTMLSGAKSEAHKGALIKNNAINLVSEKVGEQKAQRLFSGLNNEEVAKSYSALEESYKIGKRQGSYIPPNRVDNPNYLSLVAASQVSREQNNKEAEKLFMQIAREVADNPAPKKENKSVVVSAGKTVSAGDSIPIDTESFKKAIAEYNKQNPQPQYFQKTPYSAQPEVQKLSQTISAKNNNSAVSTITDISEEKTESGLSVEELVWLVDDFGKYRDKVIEGSTDKWRSTKVGTYLIEAETSEDEKHRKSEQLKKWDKVKENYKYGGLDMAFYYTKIEGKLHIVVVNLGTDGDFKHTNEFFDDWGDNIKQPFGYSDEMKKSIEQAKEIVKYYPEAHITFVGYSKGGAEAAANAVATGKDAILFNPASPILDEYNLNFDNYKAKMISYIIDGEVLSETIAKKWDVPGEKRFLGKEYNLIDSIYNDYEKYRLGFNSKNIWENTKEFLKNLKNEIGHSIDLHSLNSFYKKE